MRKALVGAIEKVWGHRHFIVSLNGDPNNPPLSDVAKPYMDFFADRKLIKN